MKITALILFFCLIFFCCIAQDSTSNWSSVKNINEIIRVIKNKTKLLHYKAFDSTSSKHFYVDKKSKELLAVEIINYYYTPPKTKISNYYRFIYYFNKEEIIKLYVIECTNRKNCKKGIFYFSNGKVIQRAEDLTEDSYLLKPFELLSGFKSFVRMKNSGG